jgi:sugar O-acyltransferase (sialic acid O-acetyltransferase NeuD family)
VLDNTVLIGYSGHGIVVTDAALAMGIPIQFYCDKTPVTNNPFDLIYLGSETSVEFRGWNENYQYVLGIGDNLLRKLVALEILSHKKQILNVIHPSASITTIYKIGMGNFISRNVSINALSSIEDFCILNTGCIIEHECKIGSNVHIAPGVVLAGNVSVGDLTFIGANSVIKQGVKIGANVIIGAGSVILKDIPDNSIIVGNPGRRI